MDCPNFLHVMIGGLPSEAVQCELPKGHGGDCRFTIENAPPAATAIAGPAPSALVWDENPPPPDASKLTMRF